MVDALAFRALHNKDFENEVLFTYDKTNFMTHIRKTLDRYGYIEIYFTTNWATVATASKYVGLIRKGRSKDSFFKIMTWWKG